MVKNFKSQLEGGAQLCGLNSIFANCGYAQVLTLKGGSSLQTPLHALDGVLLRNFHFL